MYGMAGTVCSAACAYSGILRISGRLEHEKQQWLVLAAALILGGLACIAFPRRWEPALYGLVWWWKHTPGLRPLIRGLRVALGVLAVVVGILLLLLLSLSTS